MFDWAQQEIKNLAEEPVACWESNRCVLFICLASSDPAAGQLPRSIQPHMSSFLFIPSFLHLLNPTPSPISRSEIKSKQRWQSKPSLTAKPMLIKISLRFRQHTKPFLSDWMCALCKQTNLDSFCCPLLPLCPILLQVVTALNIWFVFVPWHNVCPHLELVKIHKSNRGLVVFYGSRPHCSQALYIYVCFPTL